MGQQSSEQTEILREILKWIKFTASKDIKNVLTDALDNEQKCLIYHLSDGNRGSVEIAKLVGTSDTTIRRYWASWVRQGIVESLRVRGGERFKKSFELEDFGIEVPQIKIQTETAKPAPNVDAEQREK
jgi:predicted ArsR family transcriptional regulator